MNVKSEMESYWRGVQCRNEAVSDELLGVWKLIHKPMTERNRQLVRLKLCNLDEINSSNYRECENLVADMTDEEILRRDDIPEEAMKYIPPATRLSQGEVIELVEALKDWREKVGLPREAY